MRTGTNDSDAAGPGSVRMTWEALYSGLNGSDRFLNRLRGDGFARARVGTRRFVVLSDAEHIDHVLHSHRLNYVKSLEYESIRGTTGLNLLTDEGDSWAEHRGPMNPSFARRRLNEIVDLMTAPIEATSDRLLVEQESGPFDMHQLMIRLTLEVVANALFRQTSGELVDRVYSIAEHGLTPTEIFFRLTLAGFTGPRFWSALQNTVQSTRWLPGPLDEIRQVDRRLDAAVNDVIDQRIAHPTEHPDLLNRLIQADDGSWSRRRIRDEALTFILAGHETTANAMAWFWYLLALNPDARDKMHTEIDSVLGGRAPTTDDLAALPWTTACVQESQRYFSAVPLLARTALSADSIAGHDVAAGTTALIQSHWVHHDPAYWPEPHLFDPRRFLPDAPRPHRSAYLPFGGGRRVCIGQSFALMEMVLIAASLARNLRFDLVPGHPIEPVQTLTLRPRYGIQVVPHHRAPSPSAAASPQGREADGDAGGGQRPEPNCPATKPA